MRLQGVMAMAAWLVASAAAAGPVVREGAGANAAAIQAAVDAFRADLGANNGTATGTQPGGRREINWDGGGAGANVTLDPSPMTRFAGRGTTFVTPGSGFEISGQPSPLLVELNPAYAGLFAAFSGARIFTPLDSNVMDVLIHVPGNVAVPAGSTGFGAVFTNVDLPNTTWLRFYTPDGALLYERAVPAATGNATLSFLGVSFDAGELVGRVQIVTGNVAMGLNEKAGANVVAMDDFIYGEPVATEGLLIAPSSTRFIRTGQFDLVLGIGPWATPLVSGRIVYDGLDVTAALIGCLRPGTLAGGGVTFRCPLPGALLSPGDHVLQVELGFADASRRRTAVRWTVLGNTEP